MCVSIERHPINMYCQFTDIEVRPSSPLTPARTKLVSLMPFLHEVQAFLSLGIIALQHYAWAILNSEINKKA